MAFGKHRVDDVNPVADNDADVNPAADNDADELEGPFDVDDFDDPATAALARLDLGSVLIPMPEAGQVQVELTDMGVPSAVWVVTPNGRFTIAAYAAPKTAGLWREVASELAESLRNDVAKVSIEDGPWGREVVGVAQAEPDQPPGVVRFIGVDGYRWMIRCVVNGPGDENRGVSRRSAECIGGHCRSAWRDADAGPRPTAGGIARADGGATTCGG